MTDERIAALEQRVNNQADNFNRHLTTCGTWQQNMSDKLDGIYVELNSRLPKWASVGGMVVFGLLTGVIGWLVKAQGLG